MKKIFILTGLFLCFSSFAAAKEETPLLLDTPLTSINFVEDNSALINVQNMKKQERVERAKEEAAKNQPQKIHLDSRQINHQRALDYTTKFNDSMMLPTF